MSFNKIAVVGPGLTGTATAAVLASLQPTDGSPPPRVVVVQRNSVRSGWKVAAINEGRSPLGACEPELEREIARAVASGRLAATHDYNTCADADAIIVCVPVRMSGLVPDHSALLESLDSIAAVLSQRPRAGRPLVVIESTLAPSVMRDLVIPLFANHGLQDGRDLLLGSSPSRVRRGNAMHWITGQDKLVAGLHPEAPVMLAALYRIIVSHGRVHVTNSLTASVVKTLENAFRDVRIAFSMEVARFCDREDIDYFTLRDLVNEVLGLGGSRDDDLLAPSRGALLIPTVGVGGENLPRDGHLLWWRAIEAGVPSRNSLILAARAINDAAPAAIVRQMRLQLGSLQGRVVTILGLAYHRESGDARNSPSLVLATLLRDSGAVIRVHDPYVLQDAQFGEQLAGMTFTSDLEASLAESAAVILATPHESYRSLLPILKASGSLELVMDGCHLIHPADFEGSSVTLAGPGRGHRAPDGKMVHAIATMYRAVSRGVANETATLVRYYNDRFAPDDFSRVDLDDVLRLATTSAAGCPLERPGEVESLHSTNGFLSGLAQLAADAAPARQRSPRIQPEMVPPGIWFGNGDAVVPDLETPWPLTPQQ